MTDGKLLSLDGESPATSLDIMMFILENLPERKEKFAEQTKQKRDLLLLDEFRKYVEEYRRYQNEEIEVDLETFWKSETLKQLQIEIETKIQEAIKSGLVKSSYKFGGIGKTKKSPEVTIEQSEQPKLPNENEQPEGKSGLEDAISGGITSSEVANALTAINKAVNSIEQNELNQKNTNEQGIC